MKMNQASNTAITDATIEENLMYGYIAHRKPAFLSESLKVLGGSESANMLANGGTLLEIAIRCQNVDILERLWAHCVAYFLSPRRDEPLSDDDGDDDDDYFEDCENQRASFRRMERNFHRVTNVWREEIIGSREMKVFIDGCRAYFREATVAVAARNEYFPPADRPMHWGPREGFLPSPSACI